MTFLQRFRELGAWLKAQPDIIKELHFQTFPPVSDAEIQEVQQSIGLPLPNSLLDYFRESNGYQLRYHLKQQDEIKEHAGGFYIPSLKTIFSERNKIDDYSIPGEYSLQTLGGRDNHALRDKMYAFDRYDEWRDEQMYYGLYYVVGDNVLLCSNDYAACISDNHPITVQSYMEQSLAMAGLTRRFWMTSRGCGGNWSTVDLPRSSYATLGAWSRLIQWEYFEKITPEFFNLAAQATEGKGHHLCFMQPMVAVDAQMSQMYHSCDNCEDRITGTRYQCSECDSYDLCSKCKGENVHNEHKFWAINREGI